MSSVEEATNYLKGNADGTGNVHDHLSQVILKLFSEGHADALELLEHVSVMVKTGAKPRDAPERKPRVFCRQIAFYCLRVIVFVSMCVGIEQ